MSNKVLVKRSAVPGKVPTVNDLDFGELAINTFDGKAYIKKDDGIPSVIQIGASSGGGMTYPTAGIASSTGSAWDTSYTTSGTGTVVALSNSPTLVTPNLGTPSTLVGTNITGTASGFTAGNVTTNANLTGVITSVGNATSIASQTGTGTTFVVDTSPTLITPNLGTPSALIATNATGTASGLTAGNVTTNANLTGSVTSVGNATTVITNANLTGVITSVGNATSIASQTGTGTTFVVDTSPTLITPALGTPSALVGTNITGTGASFTAGYVTTNANLTGEATSVGNATTLTNSAVIGKVLTGYTSGAGVVADTDSILIAIQKLNGNDATNANLTGMVTSVGNAATVVTNANLTGVITSVGNATSIGSQTGTGNTFVMNTSPTLITPNLGTPSALVGTNITGTATSFTASNVTTNANLTGGVTSVGNAATVITNANLTGVITSVGNATSIASQTGTGSKFVVDDSPTLITPNLGTPSALVGTNITGTATSFTASNVTTNANLTGDVTSTGNATKIAGQSGNTGKYLKTDGTSTSWATASTTLASLTDVLLDTPLVNQLLGYNGAAWVNTNAPSAGAGAGVVLYNATPVISALGTQSNVSVATLASVPVVTAEQTATGTAASNTILFSAFISGPLNRTIIDAGVWDFTNWIGVNNVSGSNLLTRQVYTAIPFLSPYTVTMTGTGTTRTATASGGTPFATGVIDASATNTTASYLQTPSGLYQITARTSDTVVTINNVPTTYTNEVAVTGTVLKKLFGITTPEINSITPDYGLYEVTTTAGSYPITALTGIGILGFFTCSNNHTITVTYNGTEHNTHVSTPLVNLHNELAGLNGGTSGQYYHLTSAEYAGTGTGDFVRKDSPILTGIAQSAYPDESTANQIAVISWVNSKITAAAHPTLASLTDVALATPTVNQLLGYDGASWINVDAPAGGGGGPGPTLDLAVSVDDYTGNGSQVDYSLSTTPLNSGCVFVSINGVIQSTTTYSILDTTLTFSTAPSVSDVIELRTITGSGAVDSIALTTTAANQIVNTFYSTAWSTAKYMCQVKYSTHIHATEILLMHNGVNVYITEYGTMYSGASLGTFTADLSGGLIRLKFSPVNVNTTIKFKLVTITA
ncbi:hypothetical protein UFOVP1666_55 [uncultured Caudovirales phage]|uniref:Uncharacterized protein n=1 Tax=uncultured Caudovirales phage TaxID=2100421 RepID=A0A6J5PBN2_9CAUD|nr:hypothetical protein UFOVP867_10 [uncultured Caudovirales phage]CAB4171102.1 hypothetical protein UFOVP913_188 [uncultured Caudovirales phage]CAB4176621.1 hypothetical protein UFOVP993_44 [uncultured Caudovirales phage]CAB4223012.1 hypothetical protein UFOVP1666_55 [uncultured Caudovirales phage]